LKIFDKKKFFYGGKVKRSDEIKGKKTRKRLNRGKPLKDNIK